MSFVRGPQPTEPVVWIIDAEHWPRACLRAELIERGYDAVGFETVRDALVTLALPRSRPPQIVIIDLAGQKADSRQLAALAQNGRAVIGIADTIVRDQQVVLELPWLALLRRPVSLGAIGDIVDRHLRSRGDAQAP